MILKECQFYQLEFVISPFVLMTLTS